MLMKFSGNYASSLNSVPEIKTKKKGLPPQFGAIFGPNLGFIRADGQALFRLIT